MIGLFESLKDQIDSYSDPEFEEMYVDAELRLKKAKQILERTKKLNIILHVASVVLGMFFAYQEKQFSMLRATIYYMATYSFVVTVGATSITSLVGDEIVQGIDYAESRYQDIIRE